VKARPLLVGVAEVRRRLGTRRPIERRALLEGLQISASEVPFGGDGSDPDVADANVAVTVVLESISNGIVVDGQVTAAWRGACRRCLETVEGTLRAPVREVFEVSPTEGETYPLEGDTIDLEPMVRDAVLLALPLAPLCESGCRGPAPEAFPTGAVAPGDEGEGDEGGGRDPRWAALDDLRLEPPDDPGGTG
jgi:uncharacterized protein